MIAQIQIRKNDTGETFVYEDDVLWDEEKDCLSVFIWTDGNFSCDCNRKIFFDNIGYQDQDDAPCGEGAYSVNIIDPVTGKFLYKEF